MRQDDTANEVEIAAIKAFAATTKTPFKTAFAATMGVAAAQLLIIFGFFTGLTLLVTLIYLGIKYL